MDVWRESDPSREQLRDRWAISAFLDDKPEFDEGITWVLRLDTTPIYALRPAGPYAQEISRHLRKTYVSFGCEDKTRVDIVSVPGFTKGSTRLLNGQVVPILYPDLRGLYDWSIEALSDSCVLNTDSDSEKSERSEVLSDFLNRVYFELRNLGQRSADRALNYSATNAWQAAKVFERAISERLVLRDAPSVTKSPVCRPESDCYDVVLTFFDPENRLTRASRAFRFTVDVSDVIPVMVGPVRSWHVASAGVA